MSMSAFKSIKRGLNEAVADAKEKRAGVNQYLPYKVDVATLRERLGLTQEQFAARVGCSIATLRRWECGDRIPRGPALVLLNLVDKEPGVMMRALAA
jgi:putative transcriptional regulator